MEGKIGQQHLHVVVPPLHKHRAGAAPAQEGRPQVQEPRGIGQQGAQLLPLIGQKTVRAALQLAAGLGMNVAVEGIQHSAGILLHFHSGYLDQLMEGNPLPGFVAVECGVPLQIQKNQLCHCYLAPFVVDVTLGGSPPASYRIMSRAISSGSGASSASASPVSGWASSSRAAWRAGRGMSARSSVP